MEREARVSLVANLLGLDSCLRSLVGDSSLRGISGGQVCCECSSGDGSMRTSAIDQHVFC